MKQKLRIWAALAGLAVLFYTAPALADPTAALDIKVSINATKSLSVGSTSYNFGALPVNTSSVSATAIQVDNDSLALFETYTIQGANATSTGGGTPWSLVASTGVVDQYVLGAQFSNSRPANTDTAFSSDLLTTSPIVASDTTLGNGDPAQSGEDVTPDTTGNANRRFLWFRIITPLFVTDTTQRNATITLAIQ